MIEFKNNFNGGLNLDDSPYLVPNTSYIDALNVTRDAIVGSNDRAITNIVGNSQVPYVFPIENIITVSAESENQDGTTFVTLTFNGSDFIPPDWNVRLYVGDGASPDITIAGYTTVSTITINQLLINLSSTFSTVTFVSISNNQIVYSYDEGDYDTPDEWAAFSYYGYADTYKCIGSYSDSFRNTVIYFLWGLNGYHLVLEYDNATRTISPIFKNLTDSNNLDILSFTENNKINNINIYHRNVEEGEGDILFFLDSQGRPTVMDILRFKNGEYTPVTRDIIDVAKRPPLLQPQCAYGNDTTKAVNSLKDRLFRFKYRYIYDNNEKSTCSPISSVSLPVEINDKDITNTITNNNLITIALNTGEKDVKAVELLMSYVNKTNDWSDFASVTTIDKSTLGLTQTNKIASYTDPEPYTALSISFNDQNGIGVGTKIEVYFFNISTGENTLVAEYTTVLGDTAASVVTSLVSDCNGRGLTGISAGGSLGNIDIAFTTDWAFNEIIINNVTDDLAINYSFYNEGVYPVIDINESIQFFDYVPDVANAQEMPNGNVLLYGGITEGYDRNLVPNVVNTVLTKKSGVATLGQLTATWSWTARFERSYNPDRTTENYISIRGNPLVGTTVTYYRYDGRSGGGILNKGEYVTVAGDTYASVANKLLEQIIINNSDGMITEWANYIPGEIYIRYKGNTDPIYAVHIDRVAISEPLAVKSSVPTFLYSTQRKIGIAYFDKKGKTNGILYSGEVKMPPYDEEDDEMLLPYIYTQVYHKPPEWAYSYGFYLTKENTQFLYWEATTIKSDTDYYYIDISNLSLNQSKTPTKSSVLSWTFQNGDRMRLIKRVNTVPSVFNNVEVGIEGIVKDPKDLSGNVLSGTFVKVLKTINLNNSIDTYTDAKYIIQLYRNDQQKPNAANEVYYEFGQNYLIGDPTLPSRYHIGMTQNQGISPTLSNTFESVTNTRNIKFSGTVLTGTTVIINNSAIGAVVNPLASYTSQVGDGIEQIVDELITSLSTHIGTLLINVIKVSTTEIEFRISASPTSPINVTSTDIQIIAPSPDSIPAEFKFYYGDVYFRGRVIYLDDTNTESYTCLDRNFVDDYNSAVNSVDGRSSIIDINARRAYYSTLVRFSNAYQANTNINATNRFYPNNFDEYDYSFGDIMRFKVRDRFVRVFQKNKVGQVPLYHQILKEQNKESLVVTDRLLNPIQYYMGDVGIGDNPESLASYNFADYFTSNLRGVICRVSNNGIDFVSVLSKVNSWTTQYLPYMTGNYKVYGVFDNRLANYIIALEATNGTDPYTLYYDEELNSFGSFLSYHPEMMTCLNTLLITFKNGQLWTHDGGTYNRFYDENNPSTLTVLFNQNPLDKKTFTSISQIGSDLWVCPEIKTDINMYGSPMQSNLINSDFANLEGTYEASILGDANSPGGVYAGDSMKGKYMSVQLYRTGLDLVSLNSLSLKYINSPLNNR